MSADPKQTAAIYEGPLGDLLNGNDEWGVLICRNCEQIGQENEWRVGPEVADRCPECGGAMFGLKGAEAVTNG